MTKSATKKPAKPKGEYRHLIKINGVWVFDVKVKDGWKAMTGLSGEVSKEDAEKFAQTTAESWRKR